MGGGGAYSAGRRGLLHPPHSVAFQHHYFVPELLVLVAIQCMCFMGYRHSDPCQEEMRSTWAIAALTCNSFLFLSTETTSQGIAGRPLVFGDLRILPYHGGPASMATVCQGTITMSCSCLVADSTGLYRLWVHMTSFRDHL